MLTCVVSGGTEDAAKEAAALAALADRMGGGMRLTLTQQETDARQNVVLPWEQRQKGARSQARRFQIYELKSRSGFHWLWFCNHFRQIAVDMVELWLCVVSVFHISAAKAAAEQC